MSTPKVARILGGSLVLFSLLWIGGCCVNRAACTDCDGGWGYVLNEQPAPPCADCGSLHCGGHPLHRLKALVHLGVQRALTCGAGCGEVYWDEWLSDPPDCCDPCDNCGHWVGPQPCGPGLIPFNWRNLWGVRYDGQGPPGCESCGPLAGPQGPWQDEVLLSPGPSLEQEEAGPPEPPSSQLPTPAREASQPSRASPRAHFAGQRK